MREHRKNKHDAERHKAINNGGNSDGDPPLPIPNREVKPVSADGTAIPSGRVGSRQPSETFRSNSGGLFFVSGGEISVCEDGLLSQKCLFW